MQDETQNPGADAAPEPSNAPDPGAANPEEAEGLNQDAVAPEVAPEVAPDSAAASTPTDQGADAFDPSVTMRPEDLADPASPTDTDPAASADLGDPALHNTGVVGPEGTPLPGTVEQEEAPLADEPEPDEPSATDWGDWRGAGDHSDTGEVVSDFWDPPEWYEPTEGWDSGHSDTEVVSEPTPPEAVSMPHDIIMDPVPTDQEEAPPFEPETGVIPDADVGGEGSAQPLNLADQIDPNWPVLEELNSRELLEVQEVLGDPSRLSDPEVLEDLNSDQMQAVMQALVGHLNTPDTGVVGDPDDGGDVVEPSVVEDPDVIEESPHGVPDLDDYEPGTGVIPDAADEVADAPDASGAAVGGAAVGGAAVGAGAVGEAGDLGGLLDGIDFGNLGDLFGFGDETVEDIGEAVQDPVGAAVDFGSDLFGVDAEDISEVAQDPFGAISEVAEGYLGDIPVVGDILEGDIGEAVLGGLGFSVGGPLGGVISEVAGDIVEDLPVVGDVFEAAEGVVDGLGQAAEEVVDEVVGDVGEALGGAAEEIGDFFDSFW
jgi:hypothetical protein